MANRNNHYEAAFEAYLRAEQTPYVAVNEQRRALADGASLKSVDYIVSPQRYAAGGAVSWLIDVKGRRFPAGVRRRQYWKNWSTRDDVDSLTRWRARFGPAFDAALVFAYLLTGEATPVPPDEVFYHRGSAYAFVGVPLERYVHRARTLSERWETIAMPVADFRREARSLRDLLAGSSMAAATSVGR